MHESHSNDYARPAPRFRRLSRWLRSAMAGIVVLAAGHSVQEVGSWGVGDFLTRPALPAVCAAVVGEDPCADRPAAQAAVAATMSSGVPEADTPRWSKDELSLPADYRRWILVGSSVGLGYSDAASGHDAFHHVYLAPHAYAQFRDKGTFPEGTMLALEIRDPAPRVAPARQGSFAGRRLAVEIAVKDSKRFAEGWAYFDFGDGRPTARAQAPARCESCHRKHAETDHVFTQFYSGLR